MVDIPGWAIGAVRQTVAELNQHGHDAQPAEDRDEAGSASNGASMAFTERLLAKRPDHELLIPPR